jgi:hypothetical protein
MENLLAIRKTSQTMKTIEKVSEKLNQLPQTLVCGQRRK